jgi:ATP-dependent Clp protease ATP-binding subunit ClpC
MLDHYTDDARQIVFFARYQASVLRATTLETEHLWLGILRQNRRLLRRLAPHITPEAIEARLHSRATTAERQSMTADLPLSEATRRVLASHPAGPIKVQDLIVSLLREDAAG